MIHALLLNAALMTSAAQTPAPVRNPSHVEFNCADHDGDTEHELKIFRIEGTTRVLISTILLGDPAYKDAATKLVAADINVQPIAFGEYVATVTAVASVNGTPIKSDDSDESNLFQRAPGKPSTLVIK